MNRMLKLATLTSTYRANLIVPIYKELLTPNSKVLDVGCGTGVVSLYLQKNLGIQVTGTDIDNYLIVEIPFQKITNPNKLPFQNNIFDAVMINDVMHHLPYPKQSLLLKECLRLAKTVLIFDEQPTLLGKIFDLILNRIHHRQMNIPLSFRSKNNWLTLFKQMGVSFKYVAVMKPFWYPFDHVCFRICRN